MIFLTHLCWGRGKERERENIPHCTAVREFQGLANANRCSDDVSNVAMGAQYSEMYEKIFQVCSKIEIYMGVHRIFDRREVILSSWYVHVA